MQLMQFPLLNVYKVFSLFWNFSSLFVIWSVQYSFYYSFYPEAHFCLFLLSAFTKMGVQLQDNQKGEFIITYNLLQQTFSKLKIWRKFKLYWQYYGWKERTKYLVHLFIITNHWNCLKVVQNMNDKSTHYHFICNFNYILSNYAPI